MSEKGKYIFVSSCTNLKPYVPKSLSEIYDLLAPLMGGAPTYNDDMFPERTIDTEFSELYSGLEVVRKKLGEENYAATIDLADRAKALFLDDQAEDNGKTGEGIDLLLEIEKIVQATRRHRSKARLKDDEGRVTGD